MLHDEQRDRLLELLATRPRVLAYLAGHTHQDDATLLRHEGASVWGLTAGSTLVYPQLSRLVELLEEDTTGELWLRVATFRQQLGDHVDRLPKHSRCARLARRAAAGRHGAEVDTDADRVDESKAVKSANGLFYVGK